MHLFIIIAAFAFAAVTPYLGALPRVSGDIIEIMDDEPAASLAEPDSEGDHQA